MTDEENPWVELAQNGLRRPDQIEDCKDWLTRRQAAIDQIKKHMDERYSDRHPEENLFWLEFLEAGQFRLDMDKWQLAEFIKSLEEGGD